MSRGPRPVPAQAPPAVGFDDVTYGYVPWSRSRNVAWAPSSRRCCPAASASWSRPTVSTTYGARRAPSAVNRSTMSSTSRAVATGVLELAVLGDGAGLDVGGEGAGIEHVTGPQADPPSLVGVRRADALERRADLVVAAHRLGDGVVRLVPREDQVGPARHLQALARHAAGLQRVELGEQRRQVDDDTVADHRHDVVVEDAARDQLQGVAVAADDDGVAGVVATLVAHDVAVLLGQQVDDLGLALVTPLGADDDGDGHGNAPRTSGRNVHRSYRTPLDRTASRPSAGGRPSARGRNPARQHSGGANTRAGGAGWGRPDTVGARWTRCCA